MAGPRRRKTAKDREYVPDWEEEEDEEDVDPTPVVNPSSSRRGGAAIKSRARPVNDSSSTEQHVRNEKPVTRRTSKKQREEDEVHRRLEHIGKSVASQYRAVAVVVLLLVLLYIYAITPSIGVGNSFSFSSNFRAVEVTALMHAELFSSPTAASIEQLVAPLPSLTTPMLVKGPPSPLYLTVSRLILSTMSLPPTTETTGEGEVPFLSFFSNTNTDDNTSSSVSLFHTLSVRLSWFSLLCVAVSTIIIHSSCCTILEVLDLPQLDDDHSNNNNNNNNNNSNSNSNSSSPLPRAVLIALIAAVLYVASPFVWDMSFTPGDLPLEALVAAMIIHSLVSAIRMQDVARPHRLFLLFFLLGLYTTLLYPSSPPVFAITRLVALALPFTITVALSGRGHATARSVLLRLGAISIGFLLPAILVYALSYLQWSFVHVPLSLAAQPPMPFTTWMASNQEIHLSAILTSLSAVPTIVLSLLSALSSPSMAYTFASHCISSIYLSFFSAISPFTSSAPHHLLSSAVVAASIIAGVAVVSRGALSRTSPTSTSSRRASLTSWLFYALLLHLVVIVIAPVMMLPASTLSEASRAIHSDVPLSTIGNGHAHSHLLSYRSVVGQFTPPSFIILVAIFFGIGLSSITTFVLARLNPRRTPTGKHNNGQDNAPTTRHGPLWLVLAAVLCLTIAFVLVIPPPGMVASVSAPSSLSLARAYARNVLLSHRAEGEEGSRSHHVILGDVAVSLALVAVRERLEQNLRFGDSPSSSSSSSSSIDGDFVYENSVTLLPHWDLSTADALELGDDHHQHLHQQHHHRHQSIDLTRWPAASAPFHAAPVYVLPGTYTPVLTPSSSSSSPSSSLSAAAAAAAAAASSSSLSSLSSSTTTSSSSSSSSSSSPSSSPSSPSSPPPSSPPPSLSSKWDTLISHLDTLHSASPPPPPPRRTLLPSSSPSSSALFPLHVRILGASGVAQPLSQFGYHLVPCGLQYHVFRDPKWRTTASGSGGGSGESVACAMNDHVSIGSESCRIPPSFHSSQQQQKQNDTESEEVAASPPPPPRTPLEAYVYTLSEHAHLDRAHHIMRSIACGDTPRGYASVEAAVLEAISLYQAYVTRCVRSRSDPPSIIYYNLAIAYDHARQYVTRGDTEEIVLIDNLTLCYRQFLRCRKKEGRGDVDDAAAILVKGQLTKWEEYVEEKRRNM